MARRGRRPISAGRGFVLSRCRPETAAAWGRRSLGAVTVAPLEGWTVVMPTGPARARYPYDDAMASLAGRPAGVWMRPTLGFFQLGRQAVLTVNPAAWRAVTRWAIWTPREGLVAPVGLPAARPGDLLAASGVAIGESERSEHEPAAGLRAVLRNGDNDALGVLGEVLEILDLPGLELLTGQTYVADLPGARVIEPAGRHARAFDRLVAEEARHRIELEA